MTRLPESAARRYGQVFDEIAAEYDRRRPAYPDELVDHACQVAGIGSGDHVLEVGCGSGQLTRSLAARGLHVTALEPGKSLRQTTVAGVGSRQSTDGGRRRDRSASQLTHRRAPDRAAARKARR